MEAPLPGCLQMMLAKHVLTAAKRDELRQTRRLMESDAPARAALAKARPELQKVFDAACAKYSRRERSLTLTSNPNL